MRYGWYVDNFVGCLGFHLLYFEGVLSCYWGDRLEARLADLNCYAWGCFWMIYLVVSISNGVVEAFFPFYFLASR